ncbi:TspO/MBR family protein [Chloroflexota bacterium]
MRICWIVFWAGRYRERHKMTWTRDIVKLIVSIATCLCAGAIGSIFTTPAIPTWYATLEKPPFNPPNWLFAPAWTTLYLLMAISAFIIWRRSVNNRQGQKSLIIFLIQLILNALWSAVFFGLESPLYGIIIIIALWAAILLTILMFFRLSLLAGWLLLPYIGWVTFAAILNIYIFILNP